MNGMRRNRRCHEMQKPVPQKQYMKFTSRLLLTLFLFSIARVSFSQLTYATLTVQYDSAWVCNNLKLIPVRFKDTGYAKKELAERNIISFEEALKEGKVSVKEMTTPGGADVGMLTIKNHSKKSILIESGEMVAGGKQDRAFALTTLIPPDEKEVFLPVFCVEKGRWDDRIRSFKYAGPANSSLRKQINIAKKQNKIWKEIDRQLGDNSKENKTGAYLELYRDTVSTDSACFSFFTKKMKDSDSLYAGFIAITGDKIINCELFGSADMCLASYPTLLKSYLRSVNDKNGSPKVKDETIKNFLDKFLQTEEQQLKYLEDHGAIYMFDKKVIHLVAYTD